MEAKERPGGERQRSSGALRWLVQSLSKLKSTGDDLDDSVPDVVFDLSILDQLDHYVHIPD